MDESSIFLEALQKPAPADRAAYLEEACAGDAELRRSVEILLKAHAKAGDFLHKPPADLDPTPEHLVAEHSGTVIGPYKLMEQIGEGGMGLVFVAEQQHPLRRKVALKVIKPGLDTRQVIARFEAERQVLALMDHPNIAKVHDGGETASGRPYFVMELVKGVPITQYCDDNRLTPRARLELFLPVCAAVQHAHQKGIIHRDIKPSNVLVLSQDGTPVVKIIDFGVAKAVGPQLTDKTIYTPFAQFLGTPLYMSPEQAGQSGVDIDTRTDIYALGVLLYELLTGTTPFDKDRLRDASYEELRRIIREEEPPRPSTRISTLGQAAATVSVNRQSAPKRLSQICRGELDWIVMTALDKDRNRRYETASAFAADVQRYLHDEPVQACPPSQWYRFRKFARRNKRALTTATVLFVAAIALGASFAWNLTDRAARNRRLTDEVELGLSEADRQLDTGSWPAARQTVLRVRSLLAAGRENDRSNQRVVDLQSKLDMVARLEQIRSDVPNSGALVYPETEAKYARAFREFGIDVDAMPPGDAAAAIRQSQIRAELVGAIDDWARIRWLMRKEGRNSLLRIAADAHPESDSLWKRLRSALEEGRSQAVLDLAAEVEHHDLEPGAVFLLVGALETMCKPSEKSASGKSRGEIVEGLLLKTRQNHAEDFWVNFLLAMRFHTLRPQRLEEAIRYYSVALALRPQNRAARFNLGAALLDHGKYDEALIHFQQVKDRIPDSAMVRFNIGQAFRLKGCQDEAMAAYREAIRLDSRHIDARNSLAFMLRAQGKAAEAEAEYRVLIAIKPNEHKFHTDLGSVLSDQGKKVAAEAQFRESIGLEPKDHLAHCGLGVLLTDQGKLDTAEIHLRKAILHKPEDGDAHRELGFLLNKQGKVRDALASYREALKLNQRDEVAYCNLGATLRDLGRFTEAEENLRKSIKLKPNFAAARYNLGLVFHRQGKFAEAEREYQEAIRLDASDAEAHCNLGHVLAGQGRFRQAVEEFRLGHELGSRNPQTWKYSSARWLRDAERMAALDARLPKILKGEDRPADIGERLAVAQICRRPSKQLNSAAARFYAEAFAADPNLAEDLRASHRYNAASAAALAGCGQGKDAGALDGKERDRLRHQALAWLRADLAALQRLERLVDKARPVVQQKMQLWQKDEAFAGVRGEALAKLPEAEQQKWQMLWLQVEELRKRAAEGKRP